MKRQQIEDVSVLGAVIIIYIKVLLLEKHNHLIFSRTSMYEKAADWRYKCIKGSDYYVY